MAFPKHCCRDHNMNLSFYNLFLNERSWFCRWSCFHGIVIKSLSQNVECINSKNKVNILTCSLWLSPTIRGRWFTPKKKTHSRQLAIQICFAATITWTRSQCSIRTAFQTNKKLKVNFGADNEATEMLKLIVGRNRASGLSRTRILFTLPTAPRTIVASEHP